MDLSYGLNGNSGQREHPDSCVRNGLSLVELNCFCLDHSTWGSEQPYSPASIKSCYCRHLTPKARRLYSEVSRTFKSQWTHHLSTDRIPKQDRPGSFPSIQSSFFSQVSTANSRALLNSSCNRSINNSGHYFCFIQKLYKCVYLFKWHNWKEQPMQQQKYGIKSLTKHRGLI